MFAWQATVELGGGAAEGIIESLALAHAWKVKLEGEDQAMVERSRPLGLLGGSHGL